MGRSRGEVISLLLGHGADPGTTDKLFVAACLDAFMPANIFIMLILTGADLSRAAEAKRHFMTSLVAIDFCLVYNDKAGDEIQ
jgi:hypothetical protein